MYKLKGNYNNFLMHSTTSKTINSSLAFFFKNNKIPWSTYGKKELGLNIFIYIMETSYWNVHDTRDCDNLARIPNAGKTVNNEIKCTFVFWVYKFCRQLAIIKGFLFEKNRYYKSCSFHEFFISQFSCILFICLDIRHIMK